LAEPSQTWGDRKKSNTSSPESAGQGQRRDGGKEPVDQPKFTEKRKGPEPKKKNGAERGEKFRLAGGTLPQNALNKRKEKRKGQQCSINDQGLTRGAGNRFSRAQRRWSDIGRRSFATGKKKNGPKA